VDRRWAMRSNIYETLMHVNDRDELPMLTITSLQDLEPTPPSAPYLRTMLDERRDRTAEAVKNVAPHQHWRVFAHVSGVGRQHEPGQIINDIRACRQGGGC
ncbi:hypothetical protein, partial [Mycobacterium sp.]|uniref:hypothetical protein n=1 Tax=Mycobacterium sp. TaxID=1785 RepID=UPI003C733360